MGSKVRGLGLRRGRSGEARHVQEVEVAEGVGIRAEVREEGNERGGVGAQGVAVRLLEEAVEVRHLVGAAGEALDVRHEGLQGLHQCRRPRRCRCLRLRRRGRLFFSAAAAERCCLAGVGGFGMRLRLRAAAIRFDWVCLGWGMEALPCSCRAEI